MTDPASRKPSKAMTHDAMAMIMPAVPLQDVPALAESTAVEAQSISSFPSVPPLPVSATTVPAAEPVWSPLQVTGDHDHAVCNDDEFAPHRR